MPRLSMLPATAPMSNKEIRRRAQAERRYIAIQARLARDAILTAAGRAEGAASDRAAMRYLHALRHWESLPPAEAALVPYPVHRPPFE